MQIASETISKALCHVLPSIELHRSILGEQNCWRPFVLGVSGLQGSGKSTWASSIVRVLHEQYNLTAFTLSLDDLYYPHEELVEIRRLNAGNNLLQTRGQPGTHDEALAMHFFQSLLSGSSDVAVPAFDKSKFDGEGDRVPQEQWNYISRERRPDVLVFEGWCLGFQPLSEQELGAKWEIARNQISREDAKQDARLPINMLASHSLESLKVINTSLRRYCETFMGPSIFDSLIHLDTSDLENVYGWRMDQEAALRKARGAGMTDEEVIRFVKGYMPAYELYLGHLQKEAFVDGNQSGQPWKKHVRVVLDKARTVCRVEVIDREKNL